MFDRIALKVLHQFDPERAHDLSLKALQSGFVGGNGPFTSPVLKTTIAGLSLPNPLGLAAGYDKNAVAIAPLSKTAFGFLEVGAVTPRAQPGNPRPRLFRLNEDNAVINRFGFNNLGMEAARDRLAQATARSVLGLNLGANKDSEDRAGDYVKVLACCGPYIDFATVNISSPNTANLRDLQSPDALKPLLERVLEANTGLAKPLPIFLKIAPDLDDAGIGAIANIAEAAGVSGIIATNTTLARDGLKSPHAHEAGGLSGAPLMGPSTRVLARLAGETTLPLIGVGGISSAEDAYAKIRAGATALQLYSALVFGGLPLVSNILEGLEARLLADGYKNVAEAVGTDRAQFT